MTTGNLTDRIAEYGSPLDVVSNVLRGLIIARPGHVLRVADFSSVEARGIGWLSGAEKLLNTFRSGSDIYCVAAEDIYGHPCNKKEHPFERSVGKVVVLACVAAGTQVLTDRGCVAIQDVQLADKLWDGVEWVSHQGVISQGVKKVITHDGLTATSDHRVFLADGYETTLGHAELFGLRLARTGCGDFPLPFAEVDLANLPIKLSKVRRVETFDILEAGPRNRFTANDALCRNCGYQGSVGAFQAMARGYGVTVSDEDALKIVKAWRAKNPEIVGYWRDTEAAAVNAIRGGGTVFKCGAPGREARFGLRGSFLVCRLPSGRKLYYPFPKLVDYVWIKKEDTTTVAESTADGATITETVAGRSKRVPLASLPRWVSQGWEQNGEPSAGIHYSFTDPNTRQWVSGPTYGGSLVENITQAVCRDLLASAMLRLEAAGYPIVASVHDEIIAECPEDFGSTEELCQIMSVVPEWATDFPIEADGYSSKRYRK